ncbi:hypothetical protein M885DRAFT_612594 [Pelagophyceae sp. CCMP2097]|nr:hypothetical protein M885DRAFT_612594 [Pelagophyceae sp. CCMP2097]
MGPSARFEALYDYAAGEADELTLKLGDSVTVEERVDGGWLRGTSVATGARGLFPESYVRPAPPLMEPSPKRKPKQLAVKSADVKSADGAFRPHKAEVAPETAVPEEADLDQNETLRTLLELDARAEAAEAALHEERVASEAFRSAATATLALLERALQKALTPLAGVVFAAPRTLAPTAGKPGGKAQDVWDGDSGDHVPADRGDRLALALAKRLRPSVSVKAGLHRRTVAWDDLSEALAACYDDEFREQSKQRDAHSCRLTRKMAARSLQAMARRWLTRRRWRGLVAAAQRAPKKVEMMTQTLGEAALNVLTARAQGRESAHDNGRESAHYNGPKKMQSSSSAPALAASPRRGHVLSRSELAIERAAVERATGPASSVKKKERQPAFQEPASPQSDDDDADDDARLGDVLSRYARGTRALFRTYSKAFGHGRNLVAPNDFLKLCKDCSVCTQLLSRQEATAICKLSLARAAANGVKYDPGLGEAELSRALARVAVAAYSHMPQMAVSDKVAALLSHMGLTAGSPDVRRPRKADHARDDASLSPADRRGDRNDRGDRRRPRVNEVDDAGPPPARPAPHARDDEPPPPATPVARQSSRRAAPEPAAASFGRPPTNQPYYPPYGAPPYATAPPAYAPYGAAPQYAPPYGAQPPFAGAPPPFAGAPPPFAGAQPPFAGAPPFAAGNPYAQPPAFSQPPSYAPPSYAQAPYPQQPPFSQAPPYPSFGFGPPPLAGFGPPPLLFPQHAFPFLPPMADAPPQHAPPAAAAPRQPGPARDEAPRRDRP